MEKLLENLDKMIWRNIESLSEEELKEIEKKLGIKFPKEDRKYIKAYNEGQAQNIYLKIKNDIFLVDVTSYSAEYLEENIRYFFKSTGKLFKSRKLVPIIWDTEILKEKNILKGFLEHLVMYDFTKNLENPEIVYIEYFLKEKGNTEQLEYDFIEESLKEEKIGEKISDLFQYMYIGKKIDEEENLPWNFKEKASLNDIEEFQEQLKLKFPEKYLKLLEKARENALEFYLEKFNKKVPNEVVNPGYYMSLEDIKETYNIFLEDHQPYPKKLIPIKECPYGDYICLDYRGKLNATLKEPKITYYVHDEIGNRRFIHLADSYDEFLDMIEIDEEEIERREKEIEESYFYGEQPLEDD